MSVAIQKNAREEIRITRENFKGNDLVNVRVWYHDGAEMRPGKQGLAFRVELLPQILDALAGLSETEAA